jgi:hypothetical protein
MLRPAKPILLSSYLTIDHSALARRSAIRYAITNEEEISFALSIDLFGNPVYSVSCERACGVVWSWLASPPSPLSIKDGEGEKVTARSALRILHYLEKQLHGTV